MKDPLISDECRALFDLLNIGILILRKDFSICFWNHCLEEWTGIKKEEIMGQNLFVRYPALDQPLVKARFPQVFEGGPAVFFSSQFHPHLIPSLLPDGTNRIQKGSVIPVLLDTEFHAMLIIEDVTDLVRQVAAFRRMRDVAMQELTERKNAETALKVANAKLSLFSDITIFDIKNKITEARGFLSLIERHHTDKTELHSVISRIGSKLASIEQYIMLMRDYSELGTKAPQLYSVKRVIDYSKFQAPFFRVEDDPTLTGLEIYCAPLIERVFINFLENARDHGTTVTRVKISFRSEQDIGILIVEDDGIGVQQDKKEVIFSQGYGTKTKFGLYHSREILGMTGITIKETGQEGRCGRFELKIPKEGYRILRGEGSGAI